MERGGVNVLVEKEGFEGFELNCDGRENGFDRLR